MDQKTIRLGPEYDQATRRALRDVLSSINSKELTQDWVLGGSQELESVTLTVQGRRVVVESETYVGLTITGAADLVELLADLVRQRLRVS